MNRIFKKLGIDSLLELCDAINDGLLDNKGIDFSSLPTFGGKTPHDTAGIFSWNRQSMLIMDGSLATIVPRD